MPDVLINVFLFVSECSDCANEVNPPSSRFSMPLTKLGNKKYYLGIFFKVSQTFFFRGPQQEENFTLNFVC